MNSDLLENTLIPWLSGSALKKESLMIPQKWTYNCYWFKHAPGTSLACPVVETPPSNAVGAGSIPGWGAKISHLASRPKIQNIKKEAML